MIALVGILDLKTTSSVDYDCRKRMNVMHDEWDVDAYMPEVVEAEAG